MGRSNKIRKKYAADKDLTSWRRTAKKMGKGDKRRNAMADSLRYLRNRAKSKK